MGSLNPEQKLFILDNDFKYRKLFGIPGGGKTKCIIEKICELKRAGIITDYNEYLVLTFSRQACQDFILKGKKRDLLLFNNKSIRTIHSTCSSILYNNKQDSYMNIATIIYETNEWIKHNGIENLKTMKEWFSKKVIFVDEAQDISEIQYNFVCILSDIYKCPLILVGDPNQTIFQFQNGSDKYLLEHEGNYINLKTNYRSNGSIVSFLNHFRPCMLYGYITPFKKSEKKPKIIRGDIDKCLSHLLKKIVNRKCQLHDIAIIAPIKLSRSYCLSLSIVANYLSVMNIPFIKHYQDSEKDTSYKKVKEISTGKINLYTIHGSKGLEFKSVFLYNFHFYTKAYHPTKEEFLENKYLWYVGMSRAIDELYIYGLSDNILFPSIYNCPSHLYDSDTQIIPREYKFNKSDSFKDMYSIKNFITTKTILSEDKLYNLHKLFEYTMKVEDLYTVNVELYEYDMYSILYGTFIDEWMFYKSSRLDTYTNSKKRWFSTKIPLPKYLWLYIKSQMKKHKQINYYNNFIEFMSTDNDIDSEILKIIQNNLVNKNSYFEFTLDSNVCSYNQSIYYGYLDKLDKSAALLNQIKTIWDIILFQYQLDYECKYILQTDFSNHFTTILPYIQQLNLLTEFNESTLFQVPVIDTDINLKGIIDGLDTNNVIHEFKFSNNISMQDYLQLFLYALIYHTSLKNKTVVLWNLQSGKKYTSIFNDNTNSDKIKVYIKSLF
jgi:hypothetical protein